MIVLVLLILSNIVASVISWYVCYDRGYSDAKDYEYGIIKYSHISFDEFINNRNKKVKL